MKLTVFSPPFSSSIFRLLLLLFSLPLLLQLRVELISTLCSIVPCHFERSFFNWGRYRCATHFAAAQKNRLVNDERLFFSPFGRRAKKNNNRQKNTGNGKYTLIGDDLFLCACARCRQVAKATDWMHNQHHYSDDNRLWFFIWQFPTFSSFLVSYFPLNDMLDVVAIATASELLPDAAAAASIFWRRRRRRRRRREEDDDKSSNRMNS